MNRLFILLLLHEIEVAMIRVFVPFSRLHGVDNGVVIAADKFTLSVNSPEHLIRLRVLRLDVVIIERSFTSGDTVLIGTHLIWSTAYELMSTRSGIAILLWRMSMWRIVGGRERSLVAVVVSLRIVLIGLRSRIVATGMPL